MGGCTRFVRYIQSVWVVHVEVCVNIEIRCMMCVHVPGDTWGVGGV